MKTLILLVLSTSFLRISHQAAHAAPLDTASVPRVEIRAIRLTEQVAVDGILSEPVWHDAPVCSTFVQRDPVEGGRPTERTEVRIAYDDAALYVAGRLYDSAPDSIVARLNRKDAQLSSDVFGFLVDPYYDRRSGFYFALDAAGTLYDGVLYNDDWDDNSWDGVWEGKVQRDNQGWTAEIRIPFSQLRFHEKQIYVWGVNFRRDIARKNESDYIVFTPKNGSGFVSRFVDLTGIHDILPPHQVEILPYVTTKAEYLRHDTGDPFHDGSKYTQGLGADIKVGLGSNLTLDATINPDFGQVEVDPAVVNLSDVETFFDEKRPFFIEGSTTFRFGRGGANNYWNFNWWEPTLFYSRRIGRAPQRSIADSVDFSDVPSGTRILGAAKLTGKADGNWNIGTIHAVTARERADLQISGQRSRMEVEPLTYYGVFRGQKEFNEGRQGLGLLSTVTTRQFADDQLRDEIDSKAFVLGTDGWTYLDDDKAWVFTGWAAASHVLGNTTRMIELQRNSQHYFQRPDARHVSVDSSATSITGYAGRFYLNKQRGNFFFNSSLGFIDPKFEVNDLGFLGRTDIINTHIGAGYQWVEPCELYKRIEAVWAAFRSYDFGGNIIWEGLFARGFIEFPNAYWMGLNLAYNPQTINNGRTRGGPLTLNPPGYQVDLEFQSDGRKDIVLQASGGTYQSNWERSWVVNASIEWRPASNVSVSVGPGLERNIEYSQWVDRFDDPSATATFGRRYVFAVLNQTTVSANIRLNWTFTPKLSLQLFLQPLISANDYHDFRELARPGSYDFNTYGTGGSTIALHGGGYQADPDGNGPVAHLSFPNPDFNFKSLRGNAVLRWEYLPGSTLYFVWTQTRSESDNNSDFQFDRSVHQLLDTTPDNIFLIKLSYWWNK